MRYAGSESKFSSPRLALTGEDSDEAEKPEGVCSKEDKN
jgi:hypothetical protein